MGDNSVPGKKLCGKDHDSKTMRGYGGCLNSLVASRSSSGDWRDEEWLLPNGYPMVRASNRWCRPQADGAGLKVYLNWCWEQGGLVISV